MESLWPCSNNPGPGLEVNNLLSLQQKNSSVDTEEFSLTLKTTNMKKNLS